MEVVSRHFPETLKRITPQDFEAVTRPISNDEFCTLSAAYAVMALKSYSQHMAQNPPALTITEIAKDKHETQLAADGKTPEARRVFRPMRRRCVSGPRRRSAGWASFTR